MNGLIASGSAVRTPHSTSSREGETFLDQDQEQLGRWTALMRRAEDLADRVTGPVPTAAGEDTANRPQPAGFIGSLFDLHRTRDAVGLRVAEALDRIEKVL